MSCSLCSDMYCNDSSSKRVSAKLNRNKKKSRVEMYLKKLEKELDREIKSATKTLQKIIVQYEKINKRGKL